MGAQRDGTHKHAGKRIKVTLAGRVHGSVNGSAFTASAEGRQIKIRLGLSLAAAKGLWASRRGITRLNPPRRLGVQLSASIAGIPVGGMLV